MTTPTIIAPKKLIEVALPLDDINKAAAKEKSIRHGHPSTLHLWWARRPLAAARAVLFAQLVNDPSWKYSDEDLKKPGVKGSITKKRNDLFRLISEMVQWSNTTNERVLERARAEIRASWRETCDANKDHPEAKTLFDPDRMPAVQDPFAGGGAIPLEAHRLGLDSIATDLNPVAVLINKAMIEIPPKFAGHGPVGPAAGNKQTNAKATDDWSGARGLAEDVRRYGRWVREQAASRLSALYPQLKITKEMARERPDLARYEGKELTVIAWLWARTVRSPNPAFADVEVPLASSFLLSTKSGKEAYIEPVVKNGAYRLIVKRGKPDDSVKNGTKLARGANFRCIMSDTPISGDYIKAEGKAGRIGTRLTAIIAAGDRERVYLSPTEAMEALARSATPKWKPDVTISGSTQYLGVKPYGMDQLSELFTQRQLVMLNTLSDLVREVRQIISEDAKTAAEGAQDQVAEEYAEAVATYLGLVVSKMTSYHCTLGLWRAPEGKTGRAFGRQAIPMVWDFPECNPFAGAGGDWEGACEDCATLLDTLGHGAPGRADQEAAQQAATDGVPPRIISTDPPYYDNVPYADLSDFFYVWLRRSIGNLYPSLFGTITVPKAEELVAFAYRHANKTAARTFFLDGMTIAMRRIAERSHPGSPITIYYAFRQSEDDGDDGTTSTGWETFLEAVLRAGLTVTGTWPMSTELSGALKTVRNALASSIILVCRRQESVSTIARKDFVRELGRALPIAIAEMTADPIAAIAPVDLAQACIGPGMALFSKHQAVLEADGSHMTVHNALVHINKGIDEYFAHAEGELDPDTRFCIGWFEQFGFDVGEFGQADVLARAKGTSVDGVKEAGVVEAGKGKVRLYKLKELPSGWDPTKDQRTPVWEALHHLCRALGDSESEAGALLAKMPEKQDAVRQLAYRLYTLCERKGWAEHARSYNELIMSWPAIVEASHRTGHVRTQIDLV